nr:MAG TPA: hypothetical protein [Caudoviricetes sp.]
MTKEQIKNLFGDNEEVYRDFQNKFNTSPDVKNMKEKIQNLQRSFRYVQAMQLQKQLNDIEYKVAKELIDEQKAKVEKVTLTQVALTDKERNEIIDLRICLDILSDCMEGFVMDINAILQRHDNTLTFEDYNPTIKMLKEARRHLAWCSDNEDYRKYEPWGDECDKLIKSVKNKATKIKRETKKARLIAASEGRTEDETGKEEKNG